MYPGMIDKPRCSCRLCISVMRLAAIVSLTLAPAWVACAQSYPVRPIRYVVPFPAGGGVDIVARLVGQKIAESLGQQVVIDNRGGAGGIIGAEIVARAAPNGYTIVMGNVATHALNPVLFKKLPYDAVKDFTPVTLVAMIPGVLLVHPAVPANSVKELIALAKAKPGQLTYGSAGNGTPPQLSAELFKALAGVNIIHVAYKGGAPGLTDLMGGQITMYFSNIVAGVPLVQSGKLKALGVTSNKRSKIMPQLPTIAEAGLPGYEDFNWYGVLAPVGTPAPIIAKLHGTIVQTLNTPEVANWLAQQGADVVANSPDEFGQFIRKEIAKYTKIVRESGINVE